MTREFSYSFNELAVSSSDIAALLGYPDGILPEPFAEYLSEAMKQAETLIDVRGAIFITEEFRFSEKKDQIIVGDLVFFHRKDRCQRA
jgi:hypothetical protein